MLCILSILKSANLLPFYDSIKIYEIYKININNINFNNVTDTKVYLKLYAEIYKKIFEDENKWNIKEIEIL